MAFEQCADGLMDCSVWRFQDEFTVTEVEDGKTFCLQNLVWKPVRFGPPTKEQHEFAVKMFDMVVKARAKMAAVNGKAEAALATMRRARA